MIFDDRICTLGEGPLWHPEREAFYWFDIEGHRLLTTEREWQFDGPASAAGWLDTDHLLVATDRALVRLSLATGARDEIVPLEPDTPATRSNDGRADPLGGFWIGTMGKKLQRDAGAIYRYYRGELRRLFAPITIPNAICFAPDGKSACFTDTPTRIIHRVALDAHGWPSGAPEPFLDLRAEELNPDGAVIDADGALWVALWGAGRVDGFAPDGTRIGSFELSAPHTTCPAFGGAALDRMLVTSSTQNLTPAALAAMPDSGKTFLVKTDRCGQAEHQVIL